MFSLRGCFDLSVVIVFVNETKCEGKETLTHLSKVIGR